MDQVHRNVVSRRLRLPRWVTVAVSGGVLAAGTLAGAADEKAPAKPGADAADEQLTYAKHIVPILKESCVQCHRAPQANANRGPGGPGAPGAGQGGRGPGGPGGGAGGPGGRPRGPAGGLRLDDKAAMMKGGKHGKAVIPGKGDESLLYRVLKEPVTIDGEEVHAMPKARPNQDFTPIADEEIETIKKWIDQGAK